MARPAGGGRRVRLLIVIPWPLRSRGGSQRLAREIGSALSRHFDWTVDVAAGTGLPGTPATPVDETGSVREVRVTVARRAHLSRWNSRNGVEWTTHLDGLEDVIGNLQPDIVMYASHYSSTAEQTAAVAGRLQLPFVMLPAIHLDQRRHVDGAARRFYRSADLVVCQSVAERSWLRRRAGVPADRVLYLRCGWDGATIDRPAPRDAGIHLLTVGAFGRHKQVDHQLRAIAHLRDTLRLRARLTVVGALGERVVLERAQELAYKLGIEHDVEFQPDCTDAHLRDLYGSADCFLFTSRSESFGLAVLDAIGVGLTPVVYPHPTYGRLVASSGFGLVAREATPASLADAVLQVTSGLKSFDDGERLTWLRRRSWSRVSRPLARALDRLAAGH